MLDVTRITTHVRTHFRVTLGCSLSTVSPSSVIIARTPVTGIASDFVGTNPVVLYKSCERIAGRVAPWPNSAPPTTQAPCWVVITNPLIIELATGIQLSAARTLEALRSSQRCLRIRSSVAWHVGPFRRPPNSSRHLHESPLSKLLIAVCGRVWRGLVHRPAAITTNYFDGAVVDNAPHVDRAKKVHTPTNDINAALRGNSQRAPV